jgi:hypothetical protein
VSSGPGNILIRIGADTADAVRGIGTVDKALGESMTAGQRATAGLKKAALPAAAAVAGIAIAAVDATKAALEDAAAQDKLSNQLKRVTGATDDQIKSAEDYITQLSLQTGVADDELRPALGKLATATGDVTKAQDALKLAMDISAQTGKSLDSVSTALAKGYGGNTTALGKLVPGMDKAVLASKDMHKITAELADLTGGAAAEAAETNAGKFKVMENQMSELKETLGASLIPVMDALLPILQRAAKFASDNTTAIKILVGVVAGLAGGILIANAALKVYEALNIAVKAATAAWTAAQWLLNAALNANPIGLVVIALAAIAAGLLVAYNRSETFRNVVQSALGVVKVAVQSLDTAFDALKASAIATFNWVVDHWKVALFAFGPIGVAVRLIADHFDAIKAAATTAYNFIAANFTAAAFAVFKTVAGIVDKLAAAFNGVYNAVRNVIGAVSDLIGWISRIHFPKIPDLNPFKSAAPRLVAPQLVGAPRTPAARATTGGGGIQINVYGALDPEGTARTILRLLKQHERRVGIAS